MRFVIRAGLLPLFFGGYAFAGYGGIGSVESDDSGPVDLSALPIMLIGAAAGYFIERAIMRAQLRKMGNLDPSPQYLGGKTGAIIGAFALPLLIGILR